MSTDLNADLGSAFLGQRWELSPSVALRDESFGALAYHFGNRRLTFLKRRDLLAAVRALGDSATVADALVVAGVPEPQWPAYAQAMQGLAEADMIRRVEHEQVAS